MVDLFADSSQFQKSLLSMASLNPLGAVERPSNPYSPCWCQSGKKWKFCHKDRDRQERLAFGQRHASMLAPYSVGSCLHPEASLATCSTSTAIRSHTVQRRGGLAAIAESGHVLSIKKGFAEIGKLDGNVVPVSIGVRDASTFPGFCSRHDTTMFQPIERPDAALNAESIFLLSFRVIAYELAAKAAALADRSRARDESDRGFPFERQVMVQTLLHYQYEGIRNAMDRVTRWKNEYSRAHLSGDMSGFRFFGVTFDAVLPFVAAGAFLPEYDFDGNQVQALDDAAAEHLCVNVTVFNGKTVAAFGWTGVENGPSTRFVASFAALSADRQADALLSLVFEHLENVYLRPSWWTSLPPETIAVLRSRMRSGAGVQVRRPDTLVDLGARRIVPAASTGAIGRTA